MVNGIPWNGLCYKLFPGYHVRDNLEIPGRGLKKYSISKGQRYCKWNTRE